MDQRGRITGQTRAPGAYLIAAKLCEDDDVPVLRTVMCELRLPGEKKVHWHDWKRYPPPESGRRKLPTQRHARIARSDPRS